MKSSKLTRVRPPTDRTADPEAARQAASVALPHVRFAAASSSVAPAPWALRRAAAEPAVLLESAHPLTKAYYNQFRDRSDLDKRLVFEALNDRAGIACTTAKQEIAFEQVSVFVERYGYVPAANEWDRWRRSDHAPRGLKSTKYIYNAFDRTWGNLRRAFGEVLPAPDALAHRELLGPRSRYSRRDLIDLVQRWAESTRAVLRQQGYFDWCASVPPDPMLGSPPKSWKGYAEHFQHWLDLLQAAGLEHRSHIETRRRRARAEAEAQERQAADDGHFPRATTQDAKVRRRERMLNGLRQWASTCQGVLLRNDFDDHLCALGGTTGLPASAYSYYKTFGPWEQTLALVGLDHRSARAAAAQTVRRGGALPEAAGVRLRRGTPLEPEMRWLRRAARRLGPLMSYPEYGDWRNRLRRAALRHNHKVPEIPSANFFIKRLGGWPKAKVAAGVMTEAMARDGAHKRQAGRGSVIEAVGEAMASHGSLLSENRYRLWRAQVLTDRRASGDERLSIPGVDLVKSYLGGSSLSWMTARTTAYRELPLSLSDRVARRDADLADWAT